MSFMIFRGSNGREDEHQEEMVSHMRRTTGDSCLNGDGFTLGDGLRYFDIGAKLSGSRRQVRTLLLVAAALAPTNPRQQRGTILQ